MVLLTTLALAGGAMTIGAVAINRSKPLRLMDVLIDGQPKQAILLSAPTSQVITRTQQLARDLFGDTRQQQQAALNKDPVDTAQQQLIAQQ